MWMNDTANLKVAVARVTSGFDERSHCGQGGSLVPPHTRRLVSRLSLARDGACDEWFRALGKFLACSCSYQVLCFGFKLRLYSSDLDGDDDMMSTQSTALPSNIWDTDGQGLTDIARHVIGCLLTQ